MRSKDRKSPLIVIIKLNHQKITIKSDQPQKIITNKENVNNITLKS